MKSTLTTTDQPAQAQQTSGKTPQNADDVSVARPQAPALSEMRYYSQEEHERSMQAVLSHWSGDEDIWIYGYASLIWNPEFDFVEKRLGMLRGHHRALCLWSRVNRGTPQRPGLVFGLDRGGSCRGMAFRIAAREVEGMFPALWHREMTTGAYLPRWLRCDTDTGPVRALAFVMDRTNPGYVREPQTEHALEIIEGAHGRYGACVDYVVQTYLTLKAVGIDDSRLGRIARPLIERQAQRAKRA